MNSKNKFIIILLAGILLSVGLGIFVNYKLNFNKLESKQKTVKNILSSSTSNKAFFVFEDKIAKWSPINGQFESVNLPTSTDSTKNKVYLDGNSLFAVIDSNVYSLDNYLSFNFKTTIPKPEQESLLTIKNNDIYLGKAISDYNIRKINLDTLVSSDLTSISFDKCDLLGSQYGSASSEVIKFSSIIDKSEIQINCYDQYITSKRPYNSFDKIYKSSYLESNDIFVVNQYDNDLLFLNSSEKNLKLSTDFGKNWLDAQNGLNKYYLRFIFQLENDIYGFTESGEHLFKYKIQDNKWDELKIDQPFGKIIGL